MGKFWASGAAAVFLAALAGVQMASNPVIFASAANRSANPSAMMSAFAPSGMRKSGLASSRGYPALQAGTAAMFSHVEYLRLAESGNGKNWLQGGGG